MDLYGYNPGTASANESRNRVAQGNQAVLEFNKGLDAQVDTLKLEGAANAEQLLSDRNTKLGTVSANAAAKFGLKSVAGPAKTGFKTAAAARNARAAAAITPERLIANQGLASAERAGNMAARRGGLSAVQGSAVGRANLDAAEVAGTRAVKAGEIGAKVGEEAGLSAAEAAGKLAKGLGVVGGIATIGLESYKIAEGKTKFKDENGWQQAGQIASIAGGGLQILGAITAWTGFGLGVEAAGTALSLAGTAAEEIGDEDAAAKKQTDDIGDVTKQKRTYAVAQTSGVEVARSD
tara:strand:+ start:707 stop:1585 length:879 start_codon:yes stop_codon:yes gene_type:complete